MSKTTTPKTTAEKTTQQHRANRCYRELRKHLGLSYREMEWLCGLSQNMSYSIEKHHTMNVATLQCICSALQCSADWFILGTGKGPDFEAIKSRFGEIATVRAVAKSLEMASIEPETVIKKIIEDEPVSGNTK